MSAHTLVATVKALTVAHEMLAAIENGKSYSHRDWDNHLAQIELALGMDTARAASLARNIAAGQALI